MTEKSCIRCHIVKALSEFYVHKQMAGGHLNVCKDCKREYAREYGKTEKGKANDRRRNKKASRKKKKASYLKTSRKRNPLMSKAQGTVVRAIKSGKLVKPEKCQECGKETSNLCGHHESYKKEHWLDVIWLCVHCHISVYHNH